MDKFYPKNFVMWRPQILLLLLFLEAVYDSTGSGVNASYTNGEYKSHCEADDQCLPEYQCDFQAKECICRNSFRGGRYNDPGSKFAVYYDKARQKCVSPVGKVCTLENDGLHQFDCVPYAHCVSPRSRNLPDSLGLCQCNTGYEENDKHLCDIAPMIQDPNGGAIFTGSLIGSNPRSTGGEQTSENEDTGRGSGDSKAPPILKDTVDENANIEGILPVLENWKGTDLSSAAGNYHEGKKFSVFATIISVLIVNFIVH